MGVRLTSPSDSFKTVWCKSGRVFSVVQRDVAFSNLHRVRWGSVHRIAEPKDLVMGTVKAVCMSSVKGIQKKPVPAVTLVKEHGIMGDAHAGKWHRQVSLLSSESIEDFKARGADVDDGAFGENIVVEGFDLKSLPIGTKFACNDVLLELTQIGKECHAHCAIYDQVGDCIMPREGVFTRVLREGTIAPGDTMEIVS